MRDKPSFDDLEPPVITTSLIDGMTDEEWAARRLRNELVVRVCVGIIFGAMVGLLSIWHWGFVHRRFGLAQFLVVGGSAALFAALFAQRRDDETADFAAWIAFPEWKFVESLPWWAIAAFAATALGILAVLVTIVAIGHFSFGHR